MANYECRACGTAVYNTCSKCNQPLQHDVHTKENGESVCVSKCPNDHGMIKSPQCCGEDMAVS